MTQWAFIKPISLGSYHSNRQLLSSQLLFSAGRASWLILSVRLERKIDCHQSVNTACCESDRMVRNLPNGDKFSIVSRVCTTIRAMHLSVHVSRLVKTVCHLLTTHYHKMRFHTYRSDTVNSNTVSPITRIFDFWSKLSPCGWRNVKNIRLIQKWLKWR